MTLYTTISKLDSCCCRRHRCRFCSLVIIGVKRPSHRNCIACRAHTFVEIDHEIISTPILIPSVDSRSIVVSYKRQYGARSCMWFSKPQNAENCKISAVFRDMTKK